jgi:hypothetical protein
VAFEHTLGKVFTEHDVGRFRAEAVQKDFFAQVHVSSSRSKQLIDLNRTLEECQILLCLHPPDGWDLSAELDRTSVCVDRINDERATEAR